jgi:undecaprenyl-phosphate 4-deoxy-4-formamido-L-arabinose transferase
MSALLLFAGVQLAMLGVIGEYIGRMFITINGRPQSVVRDIVRGGPVRVRPHHESQPVLSIPR